MVNLVLTHIPGMHATCEKGEKGRELITMSNLKSPAGLTAGQKGTEESWKAAGCRSVCPPTSSTRMYISRSTFGFQTVKHLYAHRCREGSALCALYKHTSQWAWVPGYWASGTDEDTRDPE